MLIKEKCERVINYCIKYSHLVPPIIDDNDGYEVFDIALSDNYARFKAFKDQGYYDFEIIVDMIINGKKRMVQINVSELVNDDEHNYEFEIKLVCSGNKLEEISLPDCVINNYIDQIILDLDFSLREHNSNAQINGKTINALKTLLDGNNRILIHGTDLDSTCEILKEGLKVPDFGFSCRTTAMIDKNLTPKNIIEYDFSVLSLMPRNIIITIPNDLFESVLKKANESNKECKCMAKCESCKLGTIDEYDQWCYYDNRWYEAILKKVNGIWYIPREFIYGFTDRLGNLYLNNNYLFTDSEAVKNYKDSIEENIGLIENEFYLQKVL